MAEFANSTDYQNALGSHCRIRPASVTGVLLAYNDWYPVEEGTFSIHWYEFDHSILYGSDQLGFSFFPAYGGDAIAGPFSSIIALTGELATE